MIAAGLATLLAVGLRENAIELQNVFSGGEGGYYCFRLPALLNLPTSDGTSLALYAEARNKSCSDYAPSDLVYKVSRDNGVTWSNLSILCTDGCTDHDRAYHNSTNQPSPIVVRPSDGSLPYVQMLCNRGGEVWAARSLDVVGTKWEPLRYVGVGTPRHGVAVGPTPGVQLPSGRLVVSSYGSGGGAALLSDDGGKTWRSSAENKTNGTIAGAGEGEVAIAPNGSLVINSRPGHPYRRVLSWSEDGGESWSPPDQLMPELGGDVEGSMIRIQGTNVMLTASPWGIGPDWDHRCAGPGRCNMTVWASGDSGASWAVTAQLNETVGINPREAAAYSSMAQINNTHYALVYERDNAAHLTLVYLPIPRISHNAKP